MASFAGKSTFDLDWKYKVDLNKLKALEMNANALSGYLADLVELETTPDLIIPAQHIDRDDYRTHLTNMVDIYGRAVDAAYRQIGELR
jgi:hypothetical protein